MKSSSMNAMLISVFLAVSVYAVDVTVRWNEEHQTISGFGAGTGCPDCAGGNTSHYGNAGMYIYNLPEPKRSEVMDLLFDSTMGAGLTCFRFGESWMLEDQDGTWHWNPSNYEIGEIWVAKEAQKRGNIKFWSAPWVPPLWMKTVQSMGGGELQRQYYQRYADYKSHLIRDMRDKEGIVMMANSVQNEPHFGSASYGGCAYSPEQLRDFVRDYLGPTLERDGLGDVTVMIPESNWPQPEWAQATLNDPEASKYIGILGWHQYPDGNQPFMGAVEGKETWFTEVSRGEWYGMGDVGWSGALWLHSQFYDAVVNKSGNSWSMYMFGGDGNGGLMAIDGSNYDPTAKRFWWVAHYSRFVRPGWVRIGTSEQIVGGDARASAYKDPVSGRFAVVVGNHGISKPGPTITVNCDGFTPRNVTAYFTSGEQQNVNMRPEDVTVTNGSFSYEVPNVSIVTLVGETQDPTTANRVAAKSAPHLSVMRVPGGLLVRTDLPMRGRAELLDCRGRVVGCWELTAVGKEQILRFPSRLGAGVHVLRVDCTGHTILSCQVPGL